MDTFMTILSSSGITLLVLLAFLMLDLLIATYIKPASQKDGRNVLLVLLGAVMMYFSIEHIGGVFLGQGGAAIALACLFGGAKVGLATALVEMLLHLLLHMGGGGGVADVYGIGADFLVCVAVLRLLGVDGEVVPGLRAVALSGLAVGAAEALSLLLIPLQGRELFVQHGLVLFTVQLVSTLLFGGLLRLQRDGLRSREAVEQVELERQAFRHDLATACFDSLVKLDPDCRVLEVSEAYLARSGFSRDELLGQVFQPFEGRQACESLEGDEAGTREMVSFETQHRNRDGSVWPVEVTALRSQENRCIFVFLRDITERRQAQQVLEAKNRALRLSLEQAISALSSAMAHRDPATAGHEHRVSDLSVAIGRALGFDDERLEGLGLAAMVHDMGQIQVPAEILTRPRRLGQEEFELVKQHVATGREILKDIDFPWPIADVVWQHHENYDGSGYPRGLAGQQLLLEARIIRVADSVEAMLSHRPFRRAHSLEHTLSELEAGAGTLYDPEVAAICVQLFREGGYQLPSRVREVAA